MTRPIRRILVAVKDVRGRAPATLRKAAKLARALDARLELFHAISEPVAVDAMLLANQDLEKLGKQQRQRCLQRLEALAAPLRRTGVAVDVAAEWDHPAHEALIRRARRIRADLIVAERHAGRHLAPWLLRYADWELLRQSPVPLLLVRTSRQYDSPRILAAIDPAHEFAKTARLDQDILQLGARLATATRGSLHVVHAFVATLAGMSAAELQAPDASAQIVTRAAAQAKKRFDKALRSARLGRLAPNRRHLLARPAVDAIRQLVKDVRCDLVVMGAVSRSGLKRLAIGNTAERLLDDLPCDVLIVKPPGFASNVQPRSRGPQFVTVGPPSGLL